MLSCSKGGQHTGLSCGSMVLATASFFSLLLLPSDGVCCCLGLPARAGSEPTITLLALPRAASLTMCGVRRSIEYG